jgi:hypothetical protein
MWSHTSITPTSSRSGANLDIFQLRDANKRESLLPGLRNLEESETADCRHLHVDVTC